MTNPQPPDLFSADCARVQDALFSLADAEATTEMDTISAPELHGADRLFLEKHLLTCEECRLYRQGLQHLTQSLSGLEAVGVPTGLEDHIMANISELVGPEASEQVATLTAVPTHSRSTWKRYAPLAAAVMVIALALPFVTKPFGPQPNQAGQQMAQRPAAVSPTSAMPIPSTEQAAHPPHETTSDPTELATVPAKGTAPEPETLKTIAATRAIANAPHAQTTSRHAVQPASHQSARPSAVQPAPAGTETDVTQLASALPQSASQHFSDTYDSASESDVYYDPVSTLVGF